MLLKKYWKHLSELADLKLFAVRYLVNLILLVEILLLPIFLEPDFYNQIEFFRYALMLAPIILLGSPSGYMYLFYKNNEDLAQTLFLSAFLFAGSAGIFIYILSNSALAAATVFLFILVLALEKICVVNKQLIFASVYKSICSFMTLILGALFYLKYINWPPDTLYMTGVLVGQAIWLALFIWSRKFALTTLIMTKPEFKNHLKECLKLINKGFLINIQTYVLAAYFFCDRYFIAQHYPEHISEYSIAFSLSQIVFIALNTIAFASQQRIGSSIESYSLATHTKSLRTITFLFVALILISMPAVYLFNLVLPKYGDFYLSYLVIAILVGAYYLVSTFAVVGFYHDLHWFGLLSVVFILVINISTNYLFYSLEINYHWVLLKSSFLIFLSSLITEFRIRRELK